MLNSSLELMSYRLRQNQTKNPVKDTVNPRLSEVQGYSQQNRMIRDKRKTLDRAVLYSYQGAIVKKNDVFAQALINPDRLKQSYDDKIISIGYEYGYKTGDVFEWCGTNTHWLIYLQDLTELAYFRGNIRKCSYTLTFPDAEGNNHTLYMAIEGPDEESIKSGMKHGISLDMPNYLITFMIPKTDSSCDFFKRYQKFYLKEMPGTCWRVEAIDSISTPGILRISAKEYYSNEFEDDIKNGIAGSLIVKPEDPNTSEAEILGDTFIKPKKIYSYSISNNLANNGKWKVINNSLPIEMHSSGLSVDIKWTSSYSGQFDLIYQIADKEYKKTIIVESLF